MAVQVADIIQRGLRADQPAADTVCPGVIYYVTDELVTERSNGSVWEDYSDAGGGGGGGGAPVGAEYIVATLDATLTAERAATNSSSITWDFGTTGQAIAKRAALTGDVTASADSNATTIANAAVTLAKLADIPTNSLIGRDTASTGVPENILLNATLSMDGAGNLQREALTGDVTASAGSNVTTIANDAVTYAKIQNVSAASKLLGRGDSGSGDVQEITIGSGLTMTGTSLSASAGSGSAVDVKEDNVGVVAASTAINFGTAFDVADAGGGQANVTLDLSETNTSALPEGSNLYYTDERAQDAVGGMLLDTATIDLTYTDATPSLTADVIDASITYAKMQNVSTASKLLGRGDSGSGSPQEITLGTGLAMTGTTVSVSSFPPGSAVDVSESGITIVADSTRIDFGTGFDVANGGTGIAQVVLDLTEATTSTLPEGTNLYYTTERAQDDIGGMLVDSATIDFTYDDTGNTITAIVPDDAITYAKLQNISATDKLLGRDTAGAGNAEELTVSGGVEFTGLGGIQRSALIGDVTASAGSNTTTIASGVVSLAKLASIPTNSLIGRDTAGTGVPENILLNVTLSMDGSGNLQREALTGDVTASAGSNATTIANDAVTYAKIQNVSAASKLLGRGDSGSGDTQEITLGSNLTMTGTTLSASGGAGTSADIAEGGVTVVAAASKINFGTAFDVADAGGGQANVTLDLSETSTTALPEGTNLYYTAERTQDMIAAFIIDTAYLSWTYNDVGNALSAVVTAGSLTYDRIQNVTAASKLLGRGSAGGAGVVEEIILGSGLTMSGTTLSATGSGGSAVDVAENGSTVVAASTKINFGTGFDVASAGGGQADVTIDLTELSTSTLTEGSNLYFTNERAQDAVGGILTDTSTIDFTYDDAGNTISAVVPDNGITYAKIQNLATDRLLGRDTAGTGNVEELTVTGGLEFSGSGSIRRGALTGDVTSSAGSATTTIANAAVTYAKMQNVSAASKLLGRGDSGAGSPQEITLGSGLTMTGTTISASSSGTNVTRGKTAVSAGALTATLTHSLADATVLLIGAITDWNSGGPYQTAQDANTITVTFPNECPAGGGFIRWGVVPA